MDNVDFGPVLLRVATISAAASPFVKVAVDLIRTAFDMPKWGAPVAAFVLSLVVVFALYIALGIKVTSPVAATCVLGSLATTGLSIGMTEVQRRADGKNG